jgi:hypothetical protein
MLNSAVETGRAIDGAFGLMNLASFSGTLLLASRSRRLR